MKKVAAIFKKATPALAVFAVVVLALVLSRAYTIIKPPPGQGLEIPGVSYLRAAWLELKNILKFSRYQ
jgi:hypothetical protein